MSVFPIPTLAELPKPGPDEPAVTREARERVAAIAIAFGDKRKADPYYNPSHEEKLARAAFDSYRCCGDGFGFFVTRDPNVELFRSFAEAARTVGAADLKAILDLQVKLVEYTSTPEWRERDEDDERWYPIKDTCDLLLDLFKAANKHDGGASRFSTLVDAYLTKNAE